MQYYFVYAYAIAPASIYIYAQYDCFRNNAGSSIYQYLIISRSIKAEILKHLFEYSAGVWPRYTLFVRKPSKYSQWIARLYYFLKYFDISAEVRAYCLMMIATSRPTMLQI